jgi:hypothetical protein
LPIGLSARLHARRGIGLVPRGPGRYVHVTDRGGWGRIHRRCQGLRRSFGNRRRGPVLEQANPVLELFDPEQEILVGLAVRYTGTTQALLNGGVYEAAGAGRAFARPSNDVLDDRTALLALHPALLYQPVNGLLDPLPGHGRGSYLQENQTFQRVQHEYLPAGEFVVPMITRNSDVGFYRTYRKSNGITCMPSK